MCGVDEAINQDMEACGGHLSVLKVIIEMFTAAGTSAFQLFFRKM